MKIGQFAKKFNVSIDTVRYYMELGLVIPEKSGGQYDFDQSCQKSLEEILWLKSANFSLNEIQRIFSLKRLTSLESKEDIEYYKSLFINKKSELIDKRNQIDDILYKINEKIIGIRDDFEDQRDKLGLPLSFLNILCCPSCKSNLSLGKASIENNYIMTGELNCSCGFDAGISDGILVLRTDFKEQHFEGQSLEGHFIEQTSSDLVNLLYKSSQWMINRIKFSDTKDNIILEPGSGSGIFLRKIFELLPQNSSYICVDHDLEKLRETKISVEKHYSRGNFIFICSDFTKIPIKDHTIDILIDHYGSSNYNFIKEGYLVNILQDKVIKGGKWIGAYLNFKAGAKSLLRYPEKNRKYFYVENIIKSFENSRIRKIEAEDMGYTEKGGIYERFFIEGDRLYDFVYYGEKVE